MAKGAYTPRTPGTKPTNGLVRTSPLSGRGLSPTTRKPTNNTRSRLSSRTRRTVKQAPKKTPEKVYNQDVNANLKEAVIRGNEENSRTVNRFEGTARGLANQFSRDSSGLNNNMNQQMGNAFNNYSQTIGNEANRLDHKTSGINRGMSQRMDGALRQYGQKVGQETNRLDNRTASLNRQMGRDTNKAYSGYNERSRDLLGQMGTASEGTLGRMRGQAFAGLDTGFSMANDDMQSQMAARGLSGSGIFAKGLGDLAQSKMRAGMEANVNAHGQAIAQDDNTRGMQLSGEGNLFGAQMDNLQGNYGRNIGQAQQSFDNRKSLAGDQFAGQQANLQGDYSRNMGQAQQSFGNRMNVAGERFNGQQANLQGAYGRNMGQLGQDYGNKMGIEGQIMQNQINNTQQRQANLMGYAQLGRGMSGMSQNYLSQAGNGYAQIGQIAGSSAANQGQLNNSYNSTMQQANANQQAGKGSMTGSALGAAAMFSDERLKENIVKVGELDGHNLYTWDWNEAARGIVDDQPRFGVLAQEAVKINPDAVVVDLSTGYLKVNYPMLFAGGIA